MMGGASRCLALLLTLFSLGECFAVEQEDSSLSFLVIGDWGGQETPPYTTPAEVSVAEQMGKTASAVNSRFTLALGDNFYTHGIKNEYDRRFQETFENVYTAESLMSRWYVCAGNHDHYGNVTGEVAYTQHSKRWYFPSLYYTETVSIGTSGKTIQFVFIDTVLLAGITHPTLRHLPPRRIHEQSVADDQWAWIESTLSKSNATWLYVAGHYPVWSVAEHGPTSILVSRLRPMLEKYKVTGYLCGHDHSMQYIHPSGQSVDYIVTGAGHLTDSSQAHKNDIPSDSLKFFYAPNDPSDNHGGFTAFTVTPESSTATFYTYKGAVAYSTKNSSPRN